MLREAHHQKCAYCERRLGHEGEPVEHFRPKGRVDSRDVQGNAGGYWWLAWTWENLLVSCVTCNSAGCKGNRFDLVDDSERLAARASPPGREVSMLLDPTREDPLDFIQFFLENDGVWRPRPRAGIGEQEVRRANYTIEVLGLRNGNWPTYYTQCVTHLAAYVEGVHGAIGATRDTTDRDALHRAWRRLLGVAFARHGEYHALLWDYLREEFPEALREAWDLDLPRPGAELADDASCDASCPERLDVVL